MSFSSSERRSGRAALVAAAVLALDAYGGVRPLEPLPVLSQSIPVTGAIHDEWDWPLPGAEVVLYRLSMPLERAHLELAGRQWDDPVARARSGPDGAFELLAPEPGNYTAVARAPGRAPMESPLWPLLEATDVGVGRLFPARDWRIRVVDGRGAPVAGAAVAVQGRGDPNGPAGPGLWRRLQRQLKATDARGEASFVRHAGEHFHVGVVAGGRFLRLDGVRPADAGDAPVVATLEEVPPRHVVARLADGSPATDAVVHGVALAPHGVTGPDGSFALRSPVPKPLTLRIRSPDGQAGEVAVEPSDAARGEPLRVLLSPLPRLAGRVVDRESRKPVAGAWVMETSDPAGAVRSDRDGEFRLPVQSAAKVWISVDAPGFRRFSGFVSQDPLRGLFAVELARRTTGGPVVKRYDVTPDPER